MGGKEADTNTADVGLVLYVVALAVCGVIFLLVAGVANSRVGSGNLRRGGDQELENEDVKKSKGEDGEVAAITIVTISSVVAVLATIFITISFASIDYYPLLAFLLSALGFTVLLIIAYLFGRSAKRYAERKGYPRHGFFILGFCFLFPGWLIALCVPDRHVRYSLSVGEPGVMPEGNGTSIATQTVEYQNVPEPPYLMAGR